MPMQIKCHPTLGRGPRPYLGICVPLLLLSLAGCGDSEPPPAPTPEAAQVSIIKVEPRPVPLHSEYVGRTESSRQVNIVTRVDGFLEQRVYREGDPVKAGQVLYRMDAKPFQAQLQVAKAALSQQEAALAMARANLERIKPLVALDAASPKDLDQAIGAEKQAAAAVESARAQVLQAELNLGYTTLSSPVAGMSSDSQVAEGSYVKANTPLTFVSQVSPLWVTFSITEKDLLESRSRAEKGALSVPGTERYTVELRLADGSMFPEQGQITFTDAELNPDNGSFKIRASFKNERGLLRPGQFVTVRIHGAQIPNAVRLPQRAVMQSAKGHFVWVVGQDGKAQFRPVAVGPLLDQDWLIETGLAPGDTVVVDGGMQLRPGIPVSTVSVSDTSPPPGPNESASQTR